MMINKKNFKTIGTKFLLLFTAANLQLLPALALACDPQKDCVRDLGPFGKIRSPECELEREACRLAVCNSIASDAKSYIDTYNAQVAEIDRASNERNQHKLQIEMAAGQATDAYNNQQNICLDIKNLSDQSLAQTSSSVRILNFFQDFFQQAPSNLLEVLSSNQSLNTAEKNIAIELINLNSREEQKIKAAIDTFSGDVTPGLRELISSAAAGALNSCSYQSNQLKLNYENLVQTRSSLDAQDVDSAARRQNLVNSINQQEARKCR